MYSGILGEEGEKWMVTLIKYIQIVLTDMKYQVIKQSLSTVDILVHPLIVFQIGILSWVVVVIEKIWQYLNNEVKINNQTKQLDFIFFHTHQSDQIMRSSPLNMTIHGTSATNHSQMMKEDKYKQTLI